MYTLSQQSPLRQLYCGYKCQLIWFVLQREAVVNVLKLEDFAVTSQLTEKGLIHIEPKISLDTDGYDEDTTMPKMSLPDNYPVENSDSLGNSITLPGFSEYVDLPLLHANFGYVEN